MGEEAGCRTGILPSKANVVVAMHYRSLGLRGWNSKISPLYHYGDRVIEKMSLDNSKFELPPRTRSTFITAFSPDNSLIASCHGDHQIHILDVKTRTLIKSLPGHERSPWCVTFHPGSNEILASGSLNGEVRVWDLRGDGSESWTVDSNEHVAIASLTFHPYDHVLAIAAGNEIHFWDWSLPQPFASVKTGSEYEKVRFVRFDPWGHSILTGVANSEDDEEEGNDEPTFDHWSWLFPLSRSWQSRSGETRSSSRYRNRRRNHGSARDSAYSDRSTNDTSENSRRTTSRWPASGRRGYRLNLDRDSSRNSSNTIEEHLPPYEASTNSEDQEDSTNESSYPGRSNLAQAHQRILHAQVSVNAEIQQQYTRLQMLRQERHRLEMRLRALQNSANEVRDSFAQEENRSSSERFVSPYASSISSAIRVHRQRLLDSLNSQEPSENPTSTTRSIPTSDSLPTSSTQSSIYSNELFGSGVQSSQDELTNLLSRESPDPDNVTPMESETTNNDLWNEAIGNPSSTFESNLMSLANTAERVRRNDRNSPLTSLAQPDGDDILSIDLPDVQASATFDSIPGPPESETLGNFEINFNSPVDERQFDVASSPSIQTSFSETGNLLQPVQSSLASPFFVNGEPQRGQFHERRSDYDATMEGDNLVRDFYDAHNYALPGFRSLVQNETNSATSGLGPLNPLSYESIFSEPSPGSTPNGSTPPISRFETINTLTTTRPYPSYFCTSLLNSTSSQNSLAPTNSQPRTSHTTSSQYSPPRLQGDSPSPPPSDPPLQPSGATTSQNDPTWGMSYMSFLQDDSVQSLNRDLNPTAPSINSLRAPSLRQTALDTLLTSSVDPSPILSTNEHSRPSTSSGASTTPESLLPKTENRSSVSPSCPQGGVPLPSTSGLLENDPMLPQSDPNVASPAGGLENSPAEENSINLLNCPMETTNSVPAPGEPSSLANSSQTHAHNAPSSSSNTPTSELFSDWFNDTSGFLRVSDPTPSWIRPQRVDISTPTPENRTETLGTRVANFLLQTDNTLTTNLSTLDSIMTSSTTSQSADISRQQSVSQRTRSLLRSSRRSDEEDNVSESQSLADRRREELRTRVWRMVNHGPAREGRNAPQTTETTYPPRMHPLYAGLPDPGERTSSRIWGETYRPTPRVTHNTLRQQRQMRLNRRSMRSNINRIISSVYAENNGHRAVVLNIDSTTYRLQWWDFTKLKLPEISRSDINVIVPHCKIYNDASVDISKDGQLLAAFVPTFVGYPDNMMNVGIFSLNPSTFGQFLFKKVYGPNAVCLSFSPLNNYVCVGLKCRQFLLGEARPTQYLMAQILELSNGNSTEMPVVRHVYHPAQDRPHRLVSINTIAWIPEAGRGVVYGTNGGDLRICETSFKRRTTNEDYDDFPVDVTS